MKFGWSFVVRHPVSLLILIFFGANSCVAPQRLVKPQTRLHAHNDYEHARPLLDALDHGFCSIEADIFLVDGQLLVAHERSKVQTARTLEKMYLEPLRDRVAKNHGRVYPGGPEVTLLIDIKTEWKTTYPVLRETLKQYAEMFSTFRSETKQPNAVLALITGNRSKDMFAAETLRYAAYDGELEDLDSGLPAALIPWISSNWARNFTWRGRGPFPQNEDRKLKEIVDKAHKQGRRVRFWGAPDIPAFWEEMVRHQVDLINTDDLEGAQKFLLK
jgi:hypothetical protein